jgi:hypothetical protein
MTPVRQRREQVRLRRQRLRSSLLVLFRLLSLRCVKGFVSASKTVQELCPMISGVASPIFSPKATMNDKYKEIGAGLAVVGSIVYAFHLFMDWTGIPSDLEANFGVAVKDLFWVVSNVTMPRSGYETGKSQPRQR